MSEEEQVLKTYKEGYGLTNVESTILLNYISNLQKENEELQKELDKKDKQIDLIIQHILLGKTFMQEVCPNTTINNCNNFYKNGGCNECIKQYFYKKAEGKDE